MNKKVTFSKKIEKLYVRDCLTNERELNYPLGYRGVVITVKNHEDGEGILLSLERYLNEYDLIDFTQYDASLSSWDNKAEITFVVNDQHLDVFFEVYEDYKKNYKTITERHIRENEEIEFDEMSCDDEMFDDDEIRVTPVIRPSNHAEYEAAKRELYLEFERIIANNTEWCNEIVKVEKEENVWRKEILDAIFLAHINHLDPYWVELNVHKKEKWNFSDLIIKWARMAETGKYQLSKQIIYQV